MALAALVPVVAVSVGAALAATFMRPGRATDCQGSFQRWSLAIDHPLLDGTLVSAAADVVSQVKWLSPLVLVAVATMK